MITAAITAAVIPVLAVANNQEKTYKDLVELFRSGSEESFEKSAFSWLKNNPGSAQVPDVRMMLAEIESDTELAVERYRAVLKNYSSYGKRDVALYKLCQILDLKSKWKELRDESAQGIKIFSNGRYGIEFRFMHINSLIMLEDYDKARNETLAITEKTHDFNILARAIFTLSEIDRRTSGNSRSYIYSLRELAAGFNKSELSPSIIYRLAEFYDEKKDFNRAYSAYTDIVKLFPESPEAGMAGAKIEKLKKNNPKIVDYIPDMEMVNNSDRLAILPEYEINEAAEEIYFSVSVGPFTREKEVYSMNRLLKNFPSKRVVKAKSGYFLYIGKFRDTERAYEGRIRLAEEYGINGNIVRFSEQGNRSYIYGD
jgi:tetratricopeptide (TPR) repeat protein